MFFILATKEHGSGIWQEYVSLLQSPGHWLFEITLIIIFDIIIGALLWPLIKKAVHRHDQKFHSNDVDGEHTNYDGFAFNDKSHYLGPFPRQVRLRKSYGIGITDGSIVGIRKRFFCWRYVCRYQSYSTLIERYVRKSQILESK